jgi:hypothetical protein
LQLALFWRVIAILKRVDYSTTDRNKTSAVIVEHICETGSFKLRPMTEQRCSERALLGLLWVAHELVYIDWTKRNLVSLLMLLLQSASCWIRKARVIFSWFLFLEYIYKINKEYMELPCIKLSDIINGELKKWYCELLNWSLSPKKLWVISNIESLFTGLKVEERL